MLNYYSHFEETDYCPLEQSVLEAMATKYDIEKFNGINFSLWKLKMKALLKKDNCLVVITKRPAKLKTTIIT